MSTPFASPIYAPAILLMIAALLVPYPEGQAEIGGDALAPCSGLHRGAEGAGREQAGWSSFLDHDLILGRVDRLSRVFGFIFSIITFIGVTFSLKVEDDLQHSAALTYAGAALGVTFAGDFLTLYVFWEVMAIASTFLVLARHTRASQAAAFRYILVHVFGGLCLLAGIILYYRQTGTLEFSYVGLHGEAAWMIFIGIALNAALPPFHPWLQDAYPEATATGAVFLSAFTTKSAVYLMARTFPGTELLILSGGVHDGLSLFFSPCWRTTSAAFWPTASSTRWDSWSRCRHRIELALNGTVVPRVLPHHLQGTPMDVGRGRSCTCHRERVTCTDLGGLYKTMPLTLLFGGWRPCHLFLPWDQRFHKQIPHHRRCSPRTPCLGVACIGGGFGWRISSRRDQIPLLCVLCERQGVETGRDEQIHAHRYGLHGFHVHLSGCLSKAPL